MRTKKKTAIRSRTLALETLERRACPAAVSIAAPIAISEAGTVKTITVSLDAPSAAPVSVGYFVQGTATLGADYDLTQGGRRIGSSTGTLTFAPGQTRQTIALSTINDTLREGNETLSITLIRPRGCTLGVNKTSSTILRDDDNYTAAIVGAASISAGGDGRYTLQLSAPATKNETFYVSTVAGSATAGSDFVPLQNMPLAFRAGERSKEFRVQTRANASGEYDEQFNVQATPSTNGFPAVASFSTTIRGSGVSPSIPDILLADIRITEGNSGVTNASFEVSLSAPSSQTVSVQFATFDGTATVANRDYVSQSGVLTFAPGETRRIIQVGISGDAAVETDEFFTVTLASPVNARVIRPSATATILNDDSPSGEVPGFQITLAFTDPSLPAATRGLFQRAADRWSQIIIGDLPSAVHNGKTIDDYLFEVTIDSGMDANQLGGANFYQDSVRGGSMGLPYRGFGSFNALYIDLPGFYFTILHEMAHALGFSPDLWQKADFNLVSGFGGADPRFTGRNATRNFNTVFGTTATSVPLYEVPPVGGGSYGAHWRDSVFGSDAELMTHSWDVGQPANVISPISVITVGAFQDLGYQVNYSAADPYSPPAPTNAPTWSISDASKVEGNSGLINAAFYIELQLPPNFPPNTSVTVSYVLSNGTAVAGSSSPSDYLANTSGSVSFSWSGNAGPPARVPLLAGALYIFGDTLRENDETLFITLINPSTGSVIARQRATFTIINDDGPQQAFTSTQVLAAVAGPTTIASVPSTPRYASLHAAFPVPAVPLASRSSRDFQDDAWREFTAATRQRPSGRDEHAGSREPSAAKSAAFLSLSRA